MFFLLGRPLQKAQGPVVSNGIEVKFGRIVPHVNTLYTSVDGVGV